MTTIEIRVLLNDLENDRIERTISTTNTDKFANSPSQVVVVKARKNALNAVIPSTVKINEVDYTVVSIASGAFKECVNLLSVTIPKGVVSIGSSVFKDCYDLETVRCKMPNPCEISNDVFTGQTYNNAKLYVPKGSKHFYELTYNWNYFSNIVEE